MMLPFSLSLSLRGEQMKEEEEETMDRVVLYE